MKKGEKSKKKKVQGPNKQGRKGEREQKRGRVKTNASDTCVGGGEWEGTIVVGV